MKPEDHLLRCRATALTKVIVYTLCLTLSPSLTAATTADEQTIAELKAALEAVTQRLEKLEAANRATIPVEQLDPVVAARLDAIEKSNQAAAWTEKMKVQGDFRYRHDWENPEFSDDRDRQRIRARTALIAKPGDNVEVGFGLATGGDSPVSANQTLGGSFSTKSIDLDLAYAKWNAPVEGLSFTGGKFKNPFFRAGDNGLIWDSDLRPEGVLASFEHGGLFTNLVGLWMEEDKTGADNLIIGLQGGYQWTFDSGGRLTGGAAIYDFGNLEGLEPPLDGDSFGNSVDGNGNYLTDFRELEVFGELAFPIGSNTFTLFANYVKNLEADRFDTGWAIGAGWARSAWELQYVYQDLEADAVLGMLTDSDFAGGGTDALGHYLKASYDFTRRISLGTTVFVNDRHGNNGMEEGYDRVFLDLSFKY
ncbi:MAG: putative porin [Proteobacteria bacterium]|nr:putative porin [Pseudomonadota bacterium]